jgi:membrane protein required for colicin V production
MEILDIILILPLLYGAWQGFKKGFIMELFTVLALVVGLYAAFNFSDKFSKYMDVGEIDHSYLPAASFLVLFLLVGAMVFFGGKALEQVVKIAQLSPLNKASGAAIGLIKTLYISACILVFLVSLDKEEKVFTPKSKESSILYNVHLQVLNITLPGVKQSSMISVMDIQETANKTRMTYEQTKRAKEVADSLGLDAEDVIVIKDVHDKYVKE